MSYSREERRALCELLDETGPDAPTLCEGWTTGDLAAHLVLRERRPDAAAGGAPRAPGWLAGPGMTGRGSGGTGGGRGRPARSRGARGAAR